MTKPYNNELPMQEEIDTMLEPETEIAKRRIPVLQQLGVAVGILLLVFGTSYLPDLLGSIEQQNVEAQTPAAIETPSDEESAEDPFEDVSISGMSAFVWDVAEQRALYTKNADDQLPLASITKLMTALVAYELLGEEDAVNITVDAILQDGESGFSDGETFSLENLTDLTLLTSSNDGAYALAAAAGGSLGTGGNSATTFVEVMNIRAEEIGLTQTYFRNPTGLDLSLSEGGAYGSARDVSFLMEYIISHYPKLLELTKINATSVTNSAGAYHLAENTNDVALDIPGLIASKTGYTDLAGGNLVVAFDAGLNHPIIVSVLGSTYSGRFTDVLELVEAARVTVSQE